MDLEEQKDMVERAQKDPQAFGVIFDEYYNAIFNYVLKRTANVEDAQDITSEAFFKALNKLHQFKWRGISFSSWLYKIATNEINLHFRKKKYGWFSIDFSQTHGSHYAVDEKTPETELLEAQDALQRSSDFLQLRRLILRLPIKYQEVITLRYFEKKKIPEISEILGKKEGTVKSLLSRAVDKLSKEMKEWELQPLSGTGIVEGESHNDILKKSMKL